MKYGALPSRGLAGLGARRLHPAHHARKRRLEAGDLLIGDQRLPVHLHRDDAIGCDVVVNLRDAAAKEIGRGLEVMILDGSGSHCALHAVYERAWKICHQQRRLNLKTLTP